MVQKYADGEFQKQAPEKLNVTEGFHQDLNANAIEEPREPNFPCRQVER